MLDFFIEQPIVFYAIAGILGACIGSFLNVVIYRLPLMLERAWKAECCEILKMDLSNEDSNEPFNLCVPGSNCPKCACSIPFYHNIPIISYLLLRGRCFCEKREPISYQYFIVELLSVFMTVYIAYVYGPTIQMVFACVFSWLLIALLCIDIKHYILPDNLNLGLLWVGLFANLYELFIPLPEAVLGAIIGYVSLWFFANLFYLATKKEGMGNGDFKLFAALGAWLGWHQLPLIIITSSVVGAVYGLSLIIFKGRDKSIPIPFGPFLAWAGWVAFFWGDIIMHRYYDIMGLAY